MSNNRTSKVTALVVATLVVFAATGAGCSRATDAGSATAVAKADGYPLAVTDDGAYILVATERPSGDPDHLLANLVLKHVPSGKAYTIADGLSGLDETASLSADGRFVVWSDLQTVYRWDRNTATSTRLYGLDDFGNGDEYEIDVVSPTGGFASLSKGYAAGSIPIKVLNTSTLAITSVSASSYDVICGISNDGSRYALLHNNTESVRTASNGAVVAGSKTTPKYTAPCDGGTLSGDGKALLFESDAASLPGGTPRTAGNTNLYVYSLTSGAYTLVLKDELGVWNTAMSSSGRYAFFQADVDLVGDGADAPVYRYDLQTKATVRVTAKRSEVDWVASPSGNRVLYQAGDHFYLWTA